MAEQYRSPLAELTPEQLDQLKADAKIRSERPALSWGVPTDQVCFCDACYEAHRCQYCRGWERHVNIAERTPRNNPLGRWALITEYHDEGCPALNIEAHSGIERSDLVPQQFTFGPRNRFQPMPAAKCLDLIPPWWRREGGDTWLYRAFDEEGALLYVGITGNVAGRMRTHRRSSPWWPHCDYVELAVYETRAEAAGAERRAIRMELPRFNIAD